MRSNAKVVAFSDFNTKKGSAEAKDYGNVHLLVEDYIRDPESNLVIGVQGINLKTGEEITVGLADPERFAKFYTNSSDDWSVRLARAERSIKQRSTLGEYASKKGNKAVPQGGIVSFSEVRRDYENQKLYGRWINSVTNDPSTEIALMGAFEVKKFQGRDDKGKEFESHYIRAVFPERAVRGPDATVEVLDSFLSGKLPGTDAPLRTNLAVTVALGQETQTWVLKSPLIKPVGEGKPLSASGVKAALGAELKGYDALAAITIAAVIDHPFDDLHFARDTPHETLDNYRKLYEAVEEGTAKVSIMPGATLTPSKFQNLAFLGKRVDQEGVVHDIKNIDKEFVNRGYENAIVGVRHVSAQSEKTIHPVAKSIFANERLAEVKSQYFVRKDLNYVGHETFKRLYENELNSPLVLSSIHENDGSDFENRSIDDDLGFGLDYGLLQEPDDGPAF